MTEERVGLNDRRLAQAVVDAVDRRVSQIIRELLPAIRYGTVVGSANTVNRTVAVKLFGQQDSSPGFAYGEFPPVDGDRVRVYIDSRGDRYVDAILGRDPGLIITQGALLLPAQVDTTSGEGGELVLLPSNPLTDGWHLDMVDDLLRWHRDGYVWATLQPDGDFTATGALAGFTVATVNGNLLRWVPINVTGAPSASWDFNAVTPGSIADTARELVSVPSNVPEIIAVSVAFMVRDQATAAGSAGGANNSLLVLHENGATVAGVGYTTGVGQRGGMHHAAYVRVGGTNNRSIKTASSVATNAATFWLTATGYWTKA